MARMGANQEEREVYIEKLVPGGDGLGTSQPRTGSPPDTAVPRERIVFVPFVLQGERVRISVQERRNGYDRGELLEILSASPERVQPPCPLYGNCGGCNLQHMSYEEQLRQKIDIVIEAFRRTARIELPTVSIVPSPPFEYRNRVQFHRTASGTLGFMARRSNRVVEVNRCAIAVPAINRFIEVGEDTTHNAGRFVVFAGDEDIAVEGDGKDVAVSVAGKTLHVAATSFAQSNTEMVRKLVPHVCGGLTGRTAADLYGGSGLFSTFLRETFGDVHLVEADRTAVRLARRNFERNHVVNEGRLHLHAQTVELWIRGSGRNIVFDSVIVDPPRQGLSGEVRRFLAAKRPSQLVYVSCDPVTLARDASYLTASGFALTECLLFDFYPQTSHIEAVVKFRVGPDSSRGSGGSG
ncbi:MAG TPA: hypothetical protein VMW87_05630 [Spirochaetia bacterium]|nr:hypothetical protein [Spirochaetia bacterium]